VAVKSRSTILLGGLISTDKSKSRSKVPILGDIPLIGALFRSESKEQARTELLVLITPYVLVSPEEARAETMRLHENSQSSKTTWHTGWSDSPLGKGIEDDPSAGLDRAQGRDESVPLIREMFNEDEQKRPETEKETLFKKEPPVDAVSPSNAVPR
jgi:hypothetical protein